MIPLLITPHEIDVLLYLWITKFHFICLVFFFFSITFPYNYTAKKHSKKTGTHLVGENFDSQFNSLSVVLLGMVFKRS